MPTLLAAAGVPDVKEQLLKGMKVGDTTFKVHLDGYNLLPLLTGQTTEDPRKEFFYFNDDGDLIALRYDNWKMVFSEQRSQGTMGIWAEPFTDCGCRRSSICGRTPTNGPTSRRTPIRTG